MSKVYLVSEGSYSDYSVIAAFSTREGAEAYIAHLKGDGSTKSYSQVNDEPEEMDIDVPRETWPGAWQVTIDIDGAVTDTVWTAQTLPVGPYHWKAVGVGQRWGTPERFAGYGETPEHARRSAEELRRVTLATPEDARQRAIAAAEEAKQQAIATALDAIDAPAPAP